MMEKIKINYHVQEDVDRLNKMKKTCFNCAEAMKYLKSLGISDETIEEEIAIIYPFVTDLMYCKNCPGLASCNKENPHLCTKIIYENEMVDYQLVPCKKMIDNITFKRQFYVYDFPEEWLDTNLNTIDKTQGRKQALAKYLSFINNEPCPWIYLTGNKHTGRSFFAASLCVDAVRKNKGPVAFLNSAQRIRELADLSFDKNNKETFQKKMDLYANVPILVLDDFGNEYITDYVRDNIVSTIITTRASKRLLTIFTSDFSLEEIAILYGKNDPVGQIKAGQMVKIIKSLAKKEINLGDLAIY